jgi:hypothetical protein
VGFGSYLRLSKSLGCAELQYVLSPTSSFFLCLYSYGEGWDFGEVAKNARGVNAVQQNLAGTGIGRLASFTDIRSYCFKYNQHPLSKPVACGCSFNDRIRDTCLGGSPFGDPLRQGLLTGLALAVRHCLHISQQWYLKQ